jgi:YD repeat-containing protein
VLFLSLFLFSFIDGTKKKSDLETDHIHGKVKSIHVYDFTRPGQQHMDLDPLTISLNDTGKHSTLNYNLNGNLIENINSDGKKIESYTYDNSGNRVQSKVFNTKDYTNQESFYLYDVKGNMIENKMLTIKRDTPVTKKIYKYDDKNNLKEMDLYSKNKYMNKWLFKYDEKGNELEESKFDSSNAFVEKWIFEYNAFGNKNEMALYTDSLIERFVYSYNEHGDVTEEILYGRFNMVYHDNLYKYQYDDKGNWVRKIYSVGSTQKTNTVRVFEYY